MPIVRKLLHRDSGDPHSFLTKKRRSVLHEVGHYVGANMDGMIRGHVIIKADEDASSGAFVPDAPSSELLSSDPERWSLVSSAGAMAEYEFCGEMNIGAARSDIAAYQSMFGFLSVEQVIARWKQDHLKDIAAHAGCIGRNFDRCVRFCSDNRFLIGEYHVIPSCTLRSPRWRGLSARMDEAVWTYPMTARRRALEEFLAARSGLTFIQVA